MINVDVPEGVKVALHDNTVGITGPLGSNSRKVNDKFLKVSVSEKGISIEGVKRNDKLAKRAVNSERSFATELQNDINGVRKYFEVNMKIVFAHFPISMEIKNGEVRINNMIGERAPRISKIIGSTKVEVKGQDMRLYGTSRDDVNQTAANLRKTVRIRDKDSRTFQDGVYYAIE
jgi:large subunit ribosomal protein L6